MNLTQATIALKAQLESLGFRVVNGVSKTKIQDKELAFNGVSTENITVNDVRGRLRVSVLFDLTVRIPDTKIVDLSNVTGLTQHFDTMMDIPPIEGVVETLPVSCNYINEEHDLIDVLLRMVYIHDNG